MATEEEKAEDILSRFSSRLATGSSQTKLKLISDLRE